jgi:hypothetical protein
VSDLEAAVAEADHEVVVDNEGTVWVALEAVWTYINDEGRLSWDTSERLPVEFEPYHPLDRAGQDFIRGALTRLRIADFPESGE